MSASCAALTRVGRVGCVTFPNGGRAFGAAGTSLSVLAKRAGFEDITYDCGQGNCGSCEFVLRMGQDEGDRIRPVRMCKSKLPKAPPTSGAMALMSVDSEAAQRHFAELQRKARGA